MIEFWKTNPKQESTQEYFELCCELQEKTIREFIGFKAKNRELKKRVSIVGKQFWKVIPEAILLKIWKDFMDFGLVRNEKGVDEISKIVINNVALIETNTELCGHTQLDPAEIADSYGFKPKDIKDIWFFLVDPASGQNRISDYALDKLRPLAAFLIEAQKAEDKLLIIDHLLNIIHQRSDLASWFVEGGSQTLNKLEGRPSDNITGLKSQPQGGILCP